VVTLPNWERQNHVLALFPQRFELPTSGFVGECGIDEILNHQPLAAHPRSLPSKAATITIRPASTSHSPGWGSIVARRSDRSSRVVGEAARIATLSKTGIRRLGGVSMSMSAIMCAARSRCVGPNAYDNSSVLTLKGETMLAGTATTLLPPAQRLKPSAFDIPQPRNLPRYSAGLQRTPSAQPARSSMEDRLRRWAQRRTLCNRKCPPGAKRSLKDAR
jgi:hypothetical protein